MKMFLGAIALTFAAPALSQTPAPAADPHAAHKSMDHSKMDHSKMDHSKMGDAKMDCCKQAKADCCCCKDKAAAKPASAPAAMGHDH
ncbi:MAG TPA: hypothetical protein VFO45_08335 [Sphingomicrobium sp.]|nr:hypothetical protein [Sphingomicrobium sp.]